MTLCDTRHPSHCYIRSISSPNLKRVLHDFHSEAQQLEPYYSQCINSQHLIKFSGFQNVSFRLKHLCCEEQKHGIKSTTWIPSQQEEPHFSHKLVEKHQALQMGGDRQFQWNILGGAMRTKPAVSI